MDLGGVMLFCPDIKAMAASYRDVVGMKPDTPQPFPAHRFFRFKSKKGACHCLHRGTKPNTGRQKLIFKCNDIEALLARLKKVRPSFKPPKPNAEGRVLFDFYDIERNRIQVGDKLER